MTASIDRRRMFIARLAWLCAALVLAITSLSAFLRLSKAGLGCEPWPQCHLQAPHDSAAAPTAPGTAVAVARLAHRVAAIAALVVILLMAMTALGNRPLLASEGSQALTLLAMAVFLAVLGRWSADARVPAVTLGNLLVGVSMVALSCRLAIRCGTPTRWNSARGSGTWARWGVALLVVEIALGALVSARHAGASCPALVRCDVAGATARLFDPWTEETNASRVSAQDPDRVLLQVVHAGFAVVVVTVLLQAGARAAREGRRAGRWLAVLALLQLAIGVGMVLGGLPMALALGHNVVAALLLATSASLAADRAVLR